ncbi:MAG: hypothetical protein RLZZ188_2687 [Verrucomicrobiota bacterium]|jgi:hypothetical protein
MATIDDVLAILTRIEAKIDARPAAASPAAASPEAGRIATDAEMNGPKGNPEIRRDPKDWTGGSYVGAQMSDCPADYLEMLAGLYEWMARKDDEAGARGEKDPKGYARSGKWKWQDAALARGWAARARKQGNTNATMTDEIPF